ncbi:MAG: hypothetical protein Q7S12_03585 [bacterium]|nr:hypothetical protein [bacterium]
MIKDVRVEPLTETMSMVQITCDCGSSVLTNEATGDKSFNHVAMINPKPPLMADKILICDCGTRYIIRQQGQHFHISAVVGKRF